MTSYQHAESKLLLVAKYARVIPAPTEEWKCKLKQILHNINKHKHTRIKGALNPNFLNLTVNREKFWF